MPVSKRIFDLILALLLALVCVPLSALIAVAVLLTDGRPVLYLARRMKSPTEEFTLYKFRTMRVVASDSGVSGGDKSDRVTRIGRVLRRTRMDELPQLWNVLRGDISFVGPRPPLRQYVERFPDLYGQVLRSRPGITGLASILYHRREETLLARCRSVEETDAVYARVCVPRKAHYDLIYQRNRNLCLDLALMVKTVLRRMPLPRRHFRG